MMKHLVNAPLLGVELLISWSRENGESCSVRPDNLRAVLLHDSHFVNPDFEWQIPRDFVDKVDEMETIYKVVYGNCAQFSLELKWQGLLISCDDSYQTWDEFRAEALYVCGLISDMLGENDILSPEQLRYVDIFKGDILGGEKPIDFLEDVLEIKPSLPNRLAASVNAASKKNWFVKYLYHLPDNYHININLGDGEVGAAEAAISDFTVIAPENENSSFEETIDTMHGFAEKFFGALIEPIRPMLQEAE